MISPKSRWTKRRLADHRPADLLPAGGVRRHLTGDAEPGLAGLFVDFMLSEPFQEDIPLQMFVFPVNADAQLPEEFAQFAQILKSRPHGFRR